MTDIWKTAETYDIVCAVIALILGTRQNLGTRSRREYQDRTA